MLYVRYSNSSWCTIDSAYGICVWLKGSVFLWCQVSLGHPNSTRERLAPPVKAMEKVSWNRSFAIFATIKIKEIVGRGTWWRLTGLGCQPLLVIVFLCTDVYGHADTRLSHSWSDNSNHNHNSNTNLCYPTLPNLEWHGMTTWMRIRQHSSHCRKSGGTCPPLALQGSPPAWSPVIPMRYGSTGTSWYVG